MVNKIAYAVAVIVVAYLGYQVYLLQGERSSISNDYREVEEEYTGLSEENDSLKDDLEYLSDDYNLEKELRARFNYRLPNEKLIIIVPGEETDTATSTAE
ncbi:MAG: hypothetical protein COT88_00250 [Candidatus Colwellbacteria bacterium CG10_big_fil_rev_8_21_14_0_10_41_28]|uniref:Septum formation initiator n=1 Tax=Candidatus Colwellbacteria bacterium CG10_big_fil_rev_8_21_14_0_10_41_28 TaxID=1974539 RepID=A0A2H0VHX8_9BACT|nr:MAG: hypothetical protein COT88_00250 [Candidatus Colwellbacteria bacterium CG10_big_fil_rev_8_21_14_0_10_41_28]